MNNNDLMNSAPESRMLVVQAWPSASVSAAWPILGRMTLTGTGRSRHTRRARAGLRRHT